MQCLFATSSIQPVPSCQLVAEQNTSGCGFLNGQYPSCHCQYMDYVMHTPELFSSKPARANVKS